MTTRPTLEFLRRKLETQSEELEALQQKYDETQKQIEDIEGHMEGVLFSRRNLDVKVEEELVTIRMRAIIEALLELGYEVK